MNYVERWESYIKLLQSGPLKDNITTEPITIGNDVWIGFGCIVLKRAQIDNGVIIASGSVVKGKLKPFSLYAGNPIRLIKKLENEK